MSAAVPSEAALVEAALQASGLLDAQVLTGGALRLADDTVLGIAPSGSSDGASSAFDEASLLDVLRADVPADSPVDARTVEAVLAGIALVQSGADRSPSIGRDGSWRLGPLTGRASKPAAQYVGTVARKAERARRLADVEAAQQQAIARRDAAADRVQQARASLTALESWLARAPSTTELDRAAVVRDERESERGRAAAEASERAAALTVAGEQLARASGELRRLCSTHELPGTREALEVRGMALLELDGALAALVEQSERLLAAARRLEEDREAAERDADEAAEAAREVEQATGDARDAAAEASALLQSLGADVQRMQAELDTARDARRSAERERQSAAGAVLRLTGRQGELTAALSAAQVRLSEAVPLLAARAASIAELAQVSGLLAAALGREPEPEEQAALAGLGPVAVVGVPADRSDPPGSAFAALPRASLQLLTRWSELAVPRPTDGNAVHAEIRSLAAGPAADQEPRVVPVGGALAVLARDVTGAEQPLGRASVRLAAEVTREQELLTERESDLFEKHLLGELGDALRTRRAEATDLVRGMNDLLADVRTSQGIRVRLDWSLQDDVGADVRDAVRLLGRHRGALTPDESQRLRSALSSLIEVQHAAEPEQGYAEHLSRALDYRRWSAFTVKLQRPGDAGWSTLTRRTPLSQGEQKVVCYLPLFAAAAAHFTSVAGAAPYAPRLILLDDAFPKIDVRTHPLLFGLLVDLDLDFVLTSERLWGDHASVPSLAVYEALRAPGERGIAQYRYSWDGAVLTGEG